MLENKNTSEKNGGFSILADLTEAISGTIYWTKETEQDQANENSSNKAEKDLLSPSSLKYINILDELR